MTRKEIRQKAIECVGNLETMCASNLTFDSNFKAKCADNCPYAGLDRCDVVYGYEHGFADGVEEGKKQANIDHNIECGDCVRQITAADEERIRADAVRKFAGWFKKSNHYLCYSDTIDEVLAEYEKEQEGEQT